MYYVPLSDLLTTTHPRMDNRSTTLRLHHFSLCCISVVVVVHYYSTSPAALERKERGKEETIVGTFSFPTSSLLMLTNRKGGVGGKRADNMMCCASLGGALEEEEECQLLSANIFLFFPATISWLLVLSLSHALCCSFARNKSFSAFLVYSKLPRAQLPSCLDVPVVLPT